MASFDFFGALEGRERSVASRRVLRFTVGSGALMLGMLLAASPATAATCRFAPTLQVHKDAGVEPHLLIDATCTDPDYNESTFVIDKTEQLTLQVPDGGPLIPYTEVTGHFPATKTAATLPPGVRQSPTTFQQNYVLRFPAKEFWRNRSFMQQHPTGGGVVDNRMAFTNGAYSVNWMSANLPNGIASHRHQAAATKVAKAYANKFYGNSARIYAYVWGCSGGGIVGMAQAENVTGVWDGVQPQCMSLAGDGPHHYFWQPLYTMAIPQAKREAIAAAAAPGGTGDLYAGLNDEEKAVLNEFLSAGYPLQVIGNHFKNFMPLIDPVDQRMFDPTYEDDFWTKPGYAGAKPPNYLKAALVDGWTTITAINRDASGNITSIQFDPATLPKLGTIGESYLEYWVFAADGKTRLIDPNMVVSKPLDNKRRYSLIGNLDHATGVLTMTGNTNAAFERRPWPIENSPVLINALKVGGKIRVNNQFILAMYHYPRYSNIPGRRSYDHYRNADGSPKYPQRQDISTLSHMNYRVMGGRIETGAIETKTMIMEGMGDNMAWPLNTSSYAEMIQRTLGMAKANEMMRFYLHDNGRHASGGGIPGIFQQSMQDLMAWVEKGVVPPPSVRYTIRNGQVVAAPRAADRGGLQPVMTLTANGDNRAMVGVNQPVNLASRIEMPPRAGQIVQYNWTVAGTADPMTNLEKPQPQVNVNRTVTFDKPGTYLIRLTVNGQRDGLLNPSNLTLLENYKEVQVVVQ